MANTVETNAAKRGSPWRIIGWGSAAGLLLLPLVAMQFTREVDWDEADFITMGTMFALAGGAIELAVRASASAAYRAGAIIAVVGTFLLIWMNLAVGIIGSENNPANLMFAGVIAVAVGGSAIGRFKPLGMARAMAATAVAQALVGIIALAGNMGADGVAWPRDVIVLSIFYTGLWASSAALFRKAARG